MAIVIALGEYAVYAGPPFVTDDPEPVEYRHWEFYGASQYENSKDGITGTAPHAEVNYGIVPDMQFIHETVLVPQIGIFPLIELPTGNSYRGLGVGETTIFFPVWIQKKLGAWLTYGGGGYWHNRAGPAGKDYWQTGWELQREISKMLTIGAEIFNVTARTEDGSDETGYNAGMTVNFSEREHLLLSAGNDLNGPNSLFMYLAYQATLGPAK